VITVSLNQFLKNILNQQYLHTNVSFLEGYSVLSYTEIIIFLKTPQILTLLSGFNIGINVGTIIEVAHSHEVNRNRNVSHE